MNRLWTQITPSDYAWEREGLAFLRDHLPDHEPYRAWANFEFIAQDGSINEVDVLVTTPRGLFLIEIKSHPGEMDGDAGTWIWRHEGRERRLDNPRLLADRKAKKLASLLRTQRAARGGNIPFIETVVFLSAAHIVNRLQGPARQQVHTRRTLMEALCRTDSEGRGRRLDRPGARVVARALEQAGIKESVRARRVGLYELQDLLDEADHYQDWAARHSETGSQRRIRIYLSAGKPADEAARLQRAARREFRLLEGIEHPGILRALDLQQHDQGPALVFEYDPAAVRLDHHIAGLGARPDPQEALELIREIATSVRFAHDQRLHHRALCPRCIRVREPGAHGHRSKIGHWASAQRVLETEDRPASLSSHLSVLVREDAGPYLALEAHTDPHADGVALDVFALGAIAYLLFTGQPPAASDLALQDRLAGGQGLRVTDALNGAGQALQDLIQYATHPDPTARLGSVAEFLEYLDLVEEELTRPANQRLNDPTGAVRGDVFEGGYEVRRRLGRGASSVVFLVSHRDRQRVLKLAATPEQNPRLRAEGETLARLRHQSIIAHHETREFLGHCGLLLDHADHGTVARRLREDGPFQLELLERLGEDLLDALCHLEARGIAHRDLKPDNLGLMMQGNQLHLVLFDFSLSQVGADNFTAGTLAYLDPFLRDPGRRRWDDYAERFSAALTLFEMATGTLPEWTTREGPPPLMDGALEIDPAVFDPALREALAGFFRQALARAVKQRFGNAEEMRRAWRRIFDGARHPAGQPADPAAACPLEEAQPDTQIGLLALSAQALDTLGRLNINTVAELIRLPRNELVRMTGVGVRTRRELSALIARLRERLAVEPEPPEPAGADERASVDRLLAALQPRQRGSEAERVAFLNEYLGRLDSPPPGGLRQVHWPTLVRLAAQTGLDLEAARALHERLLGQWARQPLITRLRHDIAELLRDSGGLMTALELAEAVLLRRGSAEPSPQRERHAWAVARVAVDTEFTRREPRWILRRAGQRILIADDSGGDGEALADYAEALGQLADECAAQTPLLSPARVLERVRAVPAPGAFAGLGNHRLLRLAASASQGAALSSRAEFYPRGMAAGRSLELAQGALLGARVLRPDEVRARVRGRYPEAEPLPGRPALDSLLAGLELGFRWDSGRGAYVLPETALSASTVSRPSSHRSLAGVDDDGLALTRFEALVRESLAAPRFLALAVSPRQWRRARARLCERFGLDYLSFDALLLRHLRAVCAAMATPPRWEAVLRADAEPGGQNWRRLQTLVQRALPAMDAEVRGRTGPVLLGEVGLLGRYGLVDGWLGPLREELTTRGDGHGLVLLLVSDLETAAPMIDGVSVPTGAGSREFGRVPGSWI